MKIVALAGGVGGAKLSDGLGRLLPGANLTIVVNVGDDFEHFGLKICPDLDTVFYTLARKSNSITGWGRANESWKALDSIRSLGGPDWFQLGDRDIGLHLERTRQMREGVSLSDFCRLLCDRWGIPHRVMPATNDLLRTMVHTADLGTLPFQEYFVREKYQPAVTGFDFYGAKEASPAPGVLEEIALADYVIICPSNPWVSIDPVLAVPGIRSAIQNKIVIGVSPIVGGRTIKGPAAKMYQELGFEVSALSVAKHYQKILRGFVFDQEDIGLRNSVLDIGVTPFVTNTIMDGIKGRVRLAKEIIKFCASLEREL